MFILLWRNAPQRVPERDQARWKLVSGTNTRVEKNVNTETNSANKVQMFTRDRMKSSVKKCVQKCRYAAKNEEMWGVDLKKGVRTYLQLLLLEKGSDWVPQLGGTSSPFAVNYSCKNEKCRCIPIRADKWMRFATALMQRMTPSHFWLLLTNWIVTKVNTSRKHFFMGQK